MDRLTPHTTPQQHNPSCTGAYTPQHIFFYLGPRKPSQFNQKKQVYRGHTCAATTYEYADWCQQRSYKSAFNNYIKFCQTHNLQAPIMEANLLLFVSQLSHHTSYSNIKIHLAAIKHFLIVYGYQPFPPLPRLYMLTWAIKRQAKHKHPCCSPITIPVLKHLHSFLRTSQYAQADQAMLWAAFLTASFGFLHSAEFVTATITTFDKSAHY